jgi:hypothetical protein
MESLALVGGVVGLVVLVSYLAGRLVVRKKNQERNLMRIHLSRISQTVE